MQANGTIAFNNKPTVMKQYTYVFLFLFLGHQTANAQNTFEGKIVYEYRQLDSLSKIHFPMEHIVYYKGHKFKTVKPLEGQKHRQEVITSSSSQQSIFLDRIKEGHSYAVKYVESNTYSTKEDSVATFTNETKVIAGYTCKKALLRSQKLGLIEAYYSSEIGCRMMNFNTPFFEIDGAVLEQTVISPDGRRYKVVAKQVVREEVSDEAFSIPPDFKTITWKEWKEIKFRLGDKE
jgi:hypothetical protein